MRNLNLDQLEALREVVALGSFSAAAQRLNLTQPAISLQIKQLEARLGVRLVDDNAPDLALVTMPVRGERLAVMPLLDEPLVAVLPPGLAAPARIGPADFAGMPLILYERGGTTNRIIDSWFSRAGIAVKPV